MYKELKRRLEIHIRSLRYIASVKRLSIEKEKDEMMKSKLLAEAIEIEVEADALEIIIEKTENK